MRVFVALALRGGLIDDLVLVGRVNDTLDTGLFQKLRAVLAGARETRSALLVHASNVDGSATGVRNAAQRVSLSVGADVGVVLSALADSRVTAAVAVDTHRKDTSTTDNNCAVLTVNVGSLRNLGGKVKEGTLAARKRGVGKLERTKTVRVSLEQSVLRRGAHFLKRHFRVTFSHKFNG
jgi:hypothetical protein